MPQIDAAWRGEPPRRGAPRSWDPDRDFVQVSREAVEAVGLTDAYVFALLKYRTTNVDGWTTTMADLAEEIGIPVPTARKALDRLREGGYVSASRSDSYRAVLTWRIVWEPARSSGDDLRGHQVSPERSSPPSTQKKKKNYDNCNDGSAAVDELSDVLDRLMLNCDDPLQVLAVINRDRPDIAHPAAFIAHLADTAGEHAARGFVEGLAVA